MGVAKNNILEIDITGTSHEGEGIGRYENMAVFVPHCVEGDRIRAKVEYVKRNFAYAKVIKLLVLSRFRVEPDCRAFSRCGGCAFRHIAYEEELSIKYRRVCDALKRIGHLDLVPDGIVGSAVRNGYRNKAQYPVAVRGNDLIAGFYETGTHRIVDARECFLQPEPFARAVRAFQKWAKDYGITAYDEKTSKGLLRHIYLRQAPATGELMACAVINGDDVPERDALIGILKNDVPETVSIVLNVNKKPGNTVLGDKCITIWGKDRITDFFCGLKIEISPLSFYQVNSRQAELLYRQAGEYAGLTGGENLLDLYCGAGTIGLSMARRAGRVIGIETVREAVEDAKRNAAVNRIENAEFYCADADEACRILSEKQIRPDVVIVDPPRKGLTRQSVESVLKMSPQRLVYVSCDPATLARDLAIFKENGYSCEKAKPFDMFPRTAHVECVVLMSRVE